MGPIRFFVLILIQAAGAAVSSPSPGAAESARTIPVTVVTDRSFERIPQWRGLVRSVIQQATGDLAREPGLTFTIVGEVSWSPSPKAASLEEVLSQAVQSLDRGPGLLAVFLGEPPSGFGVMDEMGLAYLGRPALIVLAPDHLTPGRLRDHLGLYFRHELGHVFGVPHISGRSVMNPTPDGMASEFGMLGLEVLKANRNLDFNAAEPFSGSDLESLRDVYLLLQDQGNMETGLLINLGIAFNRKGNAEAAQEVFRAALAQDRNSVSARLGLAECSLSLGGSQNAQEILSDLQPDPAWLTDELGWIGSLWMELEEWEKAVRDYRRALQRDDSQVAVWFNLALALDHLEKPAEAVQAFERYLKLAPQGDRIDDARTYIKKHR